MSILAIYVIGCFIVILFYKRKVELHLELLISEKPEMMQKLTIYELLKHSSFDYKILVFYALIPYFYSNSNKKRTKFQSTLIKKIYRSLFGVYTSVFILILAMEVGARFLSNNI
jgi:hypothetical protein